MTIYHFMQK